tara:strand:- start:3888 stop:4838 length:951 start_codon:yes stop_codon:yes gene_type:complete
MARDDYGAISVISDEEREALGLGGRKPDEDEEGLFETIGKAGDKLGETQLGKKLGSILTVLILAFFGGGGDLSAFEDIFGGDDDGKPRGGCTDPTAVNYKHDADFDNGSCVFPPPVVYGCTNPDADNYNSQATHDNGRCQFLGGPVNNGTGNETQTNETVYGCMDINAENYNERAEEDDGSCEYEEYDCTANQTYFYNGLQYGNYSRETNSLNITIDIDTDCDQEALPVMVGYDVGHIKVVDNETVWNGYMWNDYFFNVTGWEGNDYKLTSGPEWFTEPYTGWYMMYVNLYADWNRNGTYEFVDYFLINNIVLEEE